jgi:hypothetical protein
MNKQKPKQQKQQQQKLSHVSLMIIAVSMIGMFFVPSIILPSNAQNTTTDSIDIESVKPHLDEAKKAFDGRNYAEALKHIDLAEDQLDIADDLIEAKLGQN